MTLAQMSQEFNLKLTQMQQEFALKMEMMEREAEMKLQIAARDSTQKAVQSQDSHEMNMQQQAERSDDDN